MLAAFKEEGIVIEGDLEFGRNCVHNKNEISETNKNEIKEEVERYTTRKSQLTVMFKEERRKYV